MYHFTSARGRDSSHSKMAVPVSGMFISWGMRSIVTGGSAGMEGEGSVDGTKILHNPNAELGQTRAPPNILPCQLGTTHWHAVLNKFPKEDPH